MKQVDYEERAKIREIRQRYYESLQAGTTAPEVAREETSPVDPPKALTLDEARALYKELSGKVSSPKWTLEDLVKKINELKAEAEADPAKKAAEEAGGGKE